MKLIKPVVLAISFSASLSGPIRAATIRVPGDYTTIQSGLNRSSVGDTVLVGPGTYSDYSVQGTSAAVAWLPDGVVLKSESGSSQTVIDLAPLGGAAVWSAAFVVSGHTSGQTVIEGFHVLNAPPHTDCTSIGQSHGVEVRDCVFEVTTPVPSNYQRGIATLDADGLVVSGCSFIRCQSPTGGSGIAQQIGDLTVEGCTFVDCGTVSALLASSGGSGFPPGALEVRDCLFQRCVTIGSGGGGGVRTDQKGGVVIERCIFDDMDAISSGAPAIRLTGIGAQLRTVSNCVFRNMDLSAGGGSCVAALDAATRVTGNTFVDIHQGHINYPVALYAAFVGPGAITFENNIVAHTSGDVAITPGPVVVSSCNVFWDNVDGIGIDLDPTDRIADPQFCDPDNGDYTLMATSPCLPALSLGCGQVGALPQGCGTVSLTPETWGKIKSNYRTGEGE